MELEEVRQQQAQKANQMREGMGALKNEQQSQIQNRGREQLAGQMSGIKNNYSQRGLLYSGLRRNAETGAAGNIAAQGAGQQAQANMGLENEADTLAGNAIQTGMQQQQMQQQANDAAYQQALQARAQQQSLGGVLSNAGSAVKGWFS